MRNIGSLVPLITATALTGYPQELRAQEKPAAVLKIGVECNRVGDSTMRNECRQNAEHLADLMHNMRRLIHSLEFSLEQGLVAMALAATLGDLDDLNDFVDGAARGNQEAASKGLQKGAAALVESIEKGRASCERIRRETVSTLQTVTASIALEFDAIEASVPYVTNLPSWKRVRGDFEKKVIAKLPELIGHQCSPPAPAQLRGKKKMPRQ